MASLGYIWWCAYRRRRDPALAAGVAFLSIEGVGLVIGGGDCPMGERQREWGDPKPFFELILPPRAAKAAVPILAALSVGGFVAVALRGPRKAQASHSPSRMSHLPSSSFASRQAWIRTGLMKRKR
jgi:hypothetical protein